MLNRVSLWLPYWILDQHKKLKLCKGLRYIAAIFQIYLPSCLWEEDFFNSSYQKALMALETMFNNWSSPKSQTVKNHPINIPVKFGSNWPSDFGEEDWNVNSLWGQQQRRQWQALSDKNSSHWLLGSGEQQW